MRRLLPLISLFMVLLLLSACKHSPTAQATVIPTPTITVEPTQVSQATPTLASTGAPTPESTTVGPPAPTADSSPTQYDLQCSTTTIEARQAFSEAVSLQNQGQDDKVEQLYLKAIDLDPNFCDAMDNLGQMLRLQGRLDEAIAWFVKSLAIFPENIAAYSNLGVAYLKSSKWSQAIEAYTRVTQISPDDPEGYYGLGRVYYAMNEYAVAITHFSKAEGIYTATNSPYLVDAQYYLGLCYFALEDYVPARNYLVKLYDMATNDGSINYILGICYLRGEPKDLEMAGQFFLKAQALDVAIPAEILTELDAAAK